MTHPLAGVRVLDLTNVLAGPFCTYQLALMGAEVIKIEKPTRGDLARQLGADRDAAERGMGASFVAVNCGKQSVTVDLKHDKGKSILKHFVSVSDVLVENFRPGVMTRLGVGYETLASINPRLVYCGISGYGSDGPLAQRPAYDQIVQGSAGVMSITGTTDSGPLRVGYPVADTVGGLTAAFAISSSLLEARSSGRGCQIDVSMLESTLATMGWVVSNYLNANVEPQLMGNSNFTAAPSGTFQTREGLLNIAANEDQQYQALCNVVARPELGSDPRFADRHARKLNREVLNRELEQALLTRSAAEWETMLINAGVPAGLLMTVPDVLRHEHIRNRGFVKEFETPEQTHYTTRCGFRFHNEDPAPGGPAPLLSADTRSWLSHFGYTPDEVDQLLKDNVV